jgi:DNA-binding NarL/FixJ family response regulator
MNLILCCGKMSLRDRWFTALVDHYTLYQTGALQELSILVKNRISFDLMLLHRPLLDTETMLYIRKKIPACKLFVLSDRPDEQEGLAFLRLGAVGYANSYISSARLQEAVRVIASGSVWVNQSLMQHLIATMAVSAATDADKQRVNSPAPGATRAIQRLQLLTKREYEIAQLVSQGASNAAIAEQLGITERTVKSHLSAIYAKTATQGRLGLALLVNNAQTHAHGS